MNFVVETGHKPLQSLFNIHTYIHTYIHTHIHASLLGKQSPFHHCWWLASLRRPQSDSQVHETRDTWRHPYWSPWHYQVTSWSPNVNMVARTLYADWKHGDKLYHVRRTSPSAQRTTHIGLLPFTSMGEASCWPLWSWGKSLSHCCWLLFKKGRNQETERLIIS